MLLHLHMYFTGFGKTTISGKRNRTKTIKGVCGEYTPFSIFINGNNIESGMGNCRHVWLHMKRVDENTTKIICKECNRVMGFFKEEEVREPDYMRRTMSFSIRDNHAEIPSIAEFFEELMDNAKEMSLDKDILEHIMAQTKKKDIVGGKVRELSDEEREEMR